MKELQNIITAIEQSKHSNQRTAIATVVKTNGSVYHRSGARMLLTESGQTIGAIIEQEHRSIKRRAFVGMGNKSFNTTRAFLKRV